MRPLHLLPALLPAAALAHPGHAAVAAGRDHRIAPGARAFAVPGAARPAPEPRA